jgi:uncharacterized repeat protein (TIGR03803 family)
MPAGARTFPTMKRLPMLLLSVIALTSCRNGGAYSTVPAVSQSGPGVPAARREPRIASENVLYAFQGGQDGIHPGGSLREAQGVLYGTTQHTGSGCHCGTVFAVNPASGQEHIVYHFRGAPDGADPDANLVGLNGTLYGTTYRGGSSRCRCGTVFAVNPSTGRERIVYSFQYKPDGALPFGNLIAVNGVLYGVTSLGGDSNGTCFSGCGTVFAINAKSDQETVLYRFQGRTDGDEPLEGLLNVNGILYGTTFRGGTLVSSGCACGTLFSVDPNSGKETVLYRFGANGMWPESSLVALSGTLYGVAGGGVKGEGIVFAFDLASGQERVVYTFQGGPNDGAVPMGVTYSNGLLYGTTDLGGLCRQSVYGCGTVFSVNPSSGRETILHDFGGDRDGARPYSGLLAVNGALYGTTHEGGHACTEKNGCGTVFSITR